MAAGKRRIKSEKLNARLRQGQHALHISKFWKGRFQGVKAGLIELNQHIADFNLARPDIICHPIMWQIWTRQIQRTRSEIANVVTHKGLATGLCNKMQLIFFMAVPAAQICRQTMLKVADAPGGSVNKLNFRSDDRHGLPQPAITVCDQPRYDDETRLHYLTAPNVRPWTNCFWQNHPKTTIGPTAAVETAESRPKNKPSGARLPSMSFDKVAASMVVRRTVQ